MKPERTLSAAAARVKRVVRRAVALLGGVDGVAATVDRGRSTVGRWISLNDFDLPCLDSAMAIDEVLCAMGHGPMVAEAMAVELGYVVLDVCSGEAIDDIGPLLAAKALRSGQFMADVAQALSDGTYTAEEKSHSLAKLDDCIAVSLRLRAALAEGAA